jgi:hypothetical protein
LQQYCQTFQSREDHSGPPSENAVRSVYQRPRALNPGFSLPTFPVVRAHAGIFAQ